MPHVKPSPPTYPEPRSVRNPPIMHSFCFVTVVRYAWYCWCHSIVVVSRLDLDCAMIVDSDESV